MLLAWKYRDVVSFVLADLNCPDGDVNITEMVEGPCRLGCRNVARDACQLHVFRRSDPLNDGFKIWHASVGKNAAHMCALKVWEPSDVLLVELDNDNFISDAFFEDIIQRHHPSLMSGQSAGIRWKHKTCPAVTGRTVEWCLINGSGLVLS